MDEDWDKGFLDMFADFLATVQRRLERFMTDTDQLIDYLLKDLDTDFGQIEAKRRTDHKPLSQDEKNNGTTNAKISPGATVTVARNPGRAGDKPPLSKLEAQNETVHERQGFDVVDSGPKSVKAKLNAPAAASGPGCHYYSYNYDATAVDEPSKFKPGEPCISKQPIPLPPPPSKSKPVSTPSNQSKPVPKPSSLSKPVPTSPAVNRPPPQPPTPRQAVASQPRRPPPARNNPRPPPARNNRRPRKSPPRSGFRRKSPIPRSLQQQSQARVPRGLDRIAQMVEDDDEWNQPGPKSDQFGQEPPIKYVCSSTNTLYSDRE